MIADSINYQLKSFINQYKKTNPNEVYEFFDIKKVIVLSQHKINLCKYTILS